MAAAPLTQVQQARALCEQGRWLEVLALVRPWQAEAPDEAKAFLYEGAALAALARPVEAETAYHRALALDDKDFRTWSRLAALLCDALKQPAEGVRCLAQAMRIDPGNKFGWVDLARMHGQLGQHQEALACAERAAALDPQMVAAHLQRGRAAQALGRPDIVRAASGALARLSAENFKPEDRS